MNKKELLSLPVKEWKTISTYDSLYIIPTWKKHSSWFALMAIIWVIDNKPVEIAWYCDDINWHIPDAEWYEVKLAQIRTDMLYPSWIVQMWWCWTFTVWASLSSIDITFKHN